MNVTFDTFCTNVEQSLLYLKRISLPANLHPPHKTSVVTASDLCTPVLQMQAAGLRRHYMSNAAKQLKAHV